MGTSPAPHSGDAKERASWVKSLALREGATLAGIANPRAPMSHARALRSWTEEGLHGPMAWWPRGDALREDPTQLLPGARSLLMVALAYEGRPSEPEDAGPRISRYAMGRDYHRVIKSLLRRVVQGVEREIGLVGWRACVDTAPLVERYWAWQAGLGWIGKNCLLIHPRHGSWLLLGALLLELDLAADAPHPSRCGRCTACLDACPTQAFVSPGRLDSARCISAHTIENRDDLLPPGFDPMPGRWLFGCDECQSCCPWNRKAAGSSPLLAADPDLEAQVARGDWPRDDAAWDELTRGKALRRMTPAMYRRNLAACGGGMGSLPSTP
jgi:epoxyqueuosine reductase